MDEYAAVACIPSRPPIGSLLQPTTPFENDWDLPTALLGNTVASEAAMLGGPDSDRIGCAVCD